MSKVQGSYTLLTTLWAVTDIRSFMQVTGPKTDIWLVKTVAVVLIPVGLCFLLADRVKKDHWLVIMIGITSSLGLAIIDFYYTASKTISRVYALDGALQVIFLLSWLGLLGGHKRLSLRW